jgi:hypothetical protein
MKKAYRMFKRNDRSGVFYIQENGKNNARSLGTTDEAEAQRLLDSQLPAIIAFNFIQSRREHPVSFAERGTGSCHDSNKPLRFGIRSRRPINSRRTEQAFLKSERTKQLWSRGILETPVECVSMWFRSFAAICLADSLAHAGKPDSQNAVAVDGWAEFVKK